MKAIFRRLIAGGAVIVGLVILYWELRDFRAADSWLWILVAGLAAVLGMIELMSKPRPLE